MDDKPLTQAAEAWLRSARKGESFMYFRGDVSRVLMTPEEAMTNSQRKQHSEVCENLRRLNKQDGGKRRPPPIPDRWRKVRPDLEALLDVVGRAETRGLVELSVEFVVKGEWKHTMTCIVQRNGLSAVRDRK